MKFQVTLVVLAAICLSLAMGAPLDDSHNAQILRYDNDNIGVDGYNFGFETSDGISQDESGVLKNAGTEHEAISVKGSVSWIGGDGQKYTLNYVADENGFQPEGDHLPKA